MNSSNQGKRNQVTVEYILRKSDCAATLICYATIYPAAGGVRRVRHDYGLSFGDFYHLLGVPCNDSQESLDAFRAHATPFLEKKVQADIARMERLAQLKDF